MPPNDEAALWHSMGRIEEGQRHLSERMGRMEQLTSQRMDLSENRTSQRMDLLENRVNQRIDLLEKRIERLLYAGLAIGGAILAAVVVGQIFG